MPKRVVRLAADGAPIRAGVAAIQAEMQVTPAFPPPVDAAAAAAAASPRLPLLDRTDIPFVTIDPPTSMDLDQALHIERAGDGYLVHYAIADVAAFVDAGGPIDAETHVRGETLYGADSKIPLHPRVLSEAAASLLPDQVRPAILWSITLDPQGKPTGARAERARVKSRAKLDYGGVQAQLAGGAADPVLQLLRDVGQLRLGLEAARGGVSLPLPEQEVVVGPDGAWTLEHRAQLPVEQWNAQISLLTGMAAAGLMLEAGIGVLRTLPPADPRDVARVRRTATALGLAWPESQPYPEFVRSLDPNTPAGAAMLVACTRTLRGSGYLAFTDGAPDPATVGHSAIAAPYAHVTAPLRRLVDRYGLEVCAAVSAGAPVPAWVRAALPGLPDTMRASSHRAGQYERAVVDLVEAAVLSSRVGEVFDGVVVSVDEKDPRRGTVMVPEPAVDAPIEDEKPLPLGEAVAARVTVADPSARKVAFEVA